MTEPTTGTQEAGKMPAGGFTAQLQTDASQRAHDVARRLDVLLADIRRQEADERPRYAVADLDLADITPDAIDADWTARMAHYRGDTRYERAV